MKNSLHHKLKRLMQGQQGNRTFVYAYEAIFIEILPPVLENIMVLHDHVPLIRWSLRGMRHLRCFPLEWDSSSGNTRKIKSKFRILFIQGMEILQSFYLGIMIFTVVGQTGIGCKLVLFPSVRMVIVTLMLFMWGNGVNLATNGGTVINTMLEFESSLQNKFKTHQILDPEHRSQRSRYIAAFLFFTNTMCPTMMVTRARRLLGSSCNPTYLGHLAGYCDSCGRQTTTPKWAWIPICVLLLDVYLIGLMLFKSFFLCFNVNLTATGAMLDYLDWLQRLGNTSRRTGLTTRINVYKCLQVLEKQLNAFASPRIVPALMFLGPVVEVFCSFIVIKLGSILLPTAGFMTYPMTIGIITSALVVYQTFAAQMGVKSQELMRLWKKETGISKLNRREIKAFQPLRVRLETCFIDRGTALVTQDMCLNQIVSLLLMEE